MGKASRDKGARWELWVANWLKSIFPRARRGVGQSRHGSDASDVENTPFWIECKNGKQPNHRGAIRQAEEATDGRPVIAICNDCVVGNRSREQTAYVTMRLSTFDNLLKMAYGGSDDE